MKKAPIQKIIFVLIPLLVFPLASYTAFQFFQRNKQLALIQSIYDQQLNSVLFSINQNAWDQFNSWTSTISSNVILSQGSGRTDDMEKAFTPLLNKHNAIMAILIYSGLDRITAATKKQFLSDNTIEETNFKLCSVLQDSIDQINRMIDMALLGYIRPLTIEWQSSQPTSMTLLIIPIIQEAESKIVKRTLAALFINNTAYIEEVVVRRIKEVSLGNYDFCIKKKNSDSFVYSTAATPVLEFDKKVPLWILPNMELLMKLRGLTIASLSRRQITNNLILLVLVNIILITGVIYLVRNTLKEIALAKLKTDFVANVSHELRTPLALIRMYAETLEMDRVPSKEKMKQYYTTIINESARLTQLINNILDFSKIEAQMKEYHFTQENPAELLLATLETYRFHLEKKGFIVEQDIDENTIKINIDKDAIVQALVNLIDNAIKYTTTIKKIKVKFWQNAKHVFISVTDYGIGIPVQEKKKIFEKFYRIENSLVHSTKGSGLGLALVAHIMKVHRGQVIVESKLGKGSTFTLVFPKEHNNKKKW